jgi:inhibitor of KinA
LFFILLVPCSLVSYFQCLNLYHPYSIFPLGDSALTIDFGNIIDVETSTKVIQLFHQLKRENISYIIDLVPAYSSLTIYYDIVALYQHKSEDITAFEVMAGIVEDFTGRAHEAVELDTRRIEIPVCYAEAFALDAEALANHNQISKDELIRIHTSTSYRVFMIGFLPGFAYMGQVDERISMPRKEIPRTHVAAGSVGIAGRQTGIYPLDSPGGWQIIGRTPMVLFDQYEKEPVTLRPGDEIKFYSITEDEFAHY